MEAANLVPHEIAQLALGDDVHVDIEVEKRREGLIVDVMQRSQVPK